MQNTYWNKVALNIELYKENKNFLIFYEIQEKEKTITIIHRKQRI